MLNKTQLYHIARSYVMRVTERQQQEDTADERRTDKPVKRSRRLVLDSIVIG